MYVSPNLSPHLCSAYVSPYPYTDIYLFLSLHVFPYIYLYTRLHTLLYPTLDLSIHLPIYPPTYLLSILVNIFNPILLSTVMYRRFSFHYNRIITHSATTTMISWSAEKIEKMMAEFCEHRNEIPAIHTSLWTGGFMNDRIATSSRIVLTRKVTWQADHKLSIYVCMYVCVYVCM